MQVPRSGLAVVGGWCRSFRMVRRSGVAQAFQPVPLLLSVSESDCFLLVGVGGTGRNACATRGDRAVQFFLCAAPVWHRLSSLCPFFLSVSESDCFLHVGVGGTGRNACATRGIEPFSSYGAPLRCGTGFPACAPFFQSSDCFLHVGMGGAQAGMPVPHEGIEPFRSFTAPEARGRRSRRERRTRGRAAQRRVARSRSAASS
jgi:hypothetical protein